MKLFGKSIALFVLIALPLGACQKENLVGQEDTGELYFGNSFEQNTLLTRSMNLGNALEAPNEGDWGVVLKEEYFQLIKQAGFTAVRIPIRWSAHAAVDSPFTIDWSFFSRVDWALGQAKKNQLAAIIDMHHYEEMFSRPLQEKKRFLALWKQIAEHYKDYSSFLLFEILNEPHDALNAQIWNIILRDALNVIRESNPKRAVIVGTAEWGGVQGLSQLELPRDDSCLIVTVHYYSPFQFTHQGAEWVQGSAAWLGTQWSGSEPEKQAVESDFEFVADWARRQNRPVFLGEFGAYSKADMESRVRWTIHVRATAEKNGFSWAYWEFCSGFGVYDAQNHLWREELLKALIP